MPSSLRKICLLAISVATAAAFGQDTPQAKPALLKPDDVHATPVTLHVRKASVKEVIDQLSKQSGMNITLNGFSNDSITLDADARPFWEVLSSACDQAHVGVPFNYGYDFSAAVPLMQGMDTSQKRRFIAGPILVNFEQFERVSQMAADPSIRDYCGINTLVIWEPRLAMAYLESFSKPTVAVDENGLSLVPADDGVDPRNPAEEKFQAPGTNGQIAFFADHSIRLKIPPQAGRRLAHLSGQIRLWVIDKTQTAEIADLKAAEKSRPAIPVNDTLSLKLRNIWMNGDQAQIQLGATRLKDESIEQWQQRRSRLCAIRGKILDAAGKDWAASGSRAYPQIGGDDSLNLYLQFQHPNGTKSSPKKLVLDVPVSAAEIDVPYELKDLPLP